MENKSIGYTEFGIIGASNAPVCTRRSLLAADVPQAPCIGAAPPDAQAANGVCRPVHTGRSRFGSLLLVDHRPSSLCHSATNEPQSM